MAAYYNEFDPQAAAWLRELISAGHIAPGFVDERSIADVRAEQLEGFTQCHFFAGIGGWSHALRLAGWSDDRPVWTGSPPCQPFSNAGKQKAQSDARHLWPVFFNLIAKCKPANIFGEQVEAAIRTGWLDDLQDDLEAQGYATGKIVLPACSIGAPHVRQRIWFVAERLEHAELQCERSTRRQSQGVGDSAGASEIGGLAHTDSAGLGEHCRSKSIPEEQFTTECVGDAGGLAEPSSQRQRRREGLQAGCLDDGTYAERRQDNDGLVGIGEASNVVRSTNASDGFWAAPDWLYCRDGKWRPVESGTFPLANGVSGRVGLLRGYGNAIIPQVAAEIIKGYMSL